MHSPWGTPLRLDSGGATWAAWAWVPTCSVAPWRTMLSRSLTPSPMVTPSPMETLGPSCGEQHNRRPWRVPNPVPSQDR